MLSDFNDLLITPAKTSSVRSRTEINPYYNISGNPMSPIIVSPMDTVIGLSNWKLFINNKMPICFPRGINPENFPVSDLMYLNWYSDSIFFSYSLDETNNLINLIKGKRETNPEFDLKYNILIDIANGHMQHLVDLIKELRSLTSVKIMAGNVANPKTYKVLSKAGADFVRVGIGFGGGCLTAMNTGVGYSMAQLVLECAEEKEKLDAYDYPSAKIVADGGFREYSDIIKALALGADFVMLGSMLNKCLESAGDCYLWKIKIPQTLAENLYQRGLKIEKKFRGMSTKEVQKMWGKSELKTSEGVVRMRTVKYTLSGWSENFIDYLKSAMSYTDCRTLEDFIGNVKWTIISQNSFNRFNK